MGLRSVRLAILFESATLEQVFQKRIKNTRGGGDAITTAIATLVFFKFYFEARVFSPVLLIYCTTLAIALLTDHAFARKWKPVAQPVAGIVGNTTLKILAPICYQSKWFSVGSSVPRAFSVILTQSRVLQSFFCLGLWSTTGGTFLGDLGFMTALQYLSTWWNKDECEILCAAQPDLASAFGRMDSVFAGLFNWPGSPPQPIRACLISRIVLQVTVGGILPIAMAYRREMKERAAFLRSTKVHIPARIWSDYVCDALICCGIVFFSIGCMSALFMAVPELYSYPIILAKGWNAATIF